MSIGSGTLFPQSRSKDTTNKLNSYQDRRFTNRCRSILKSTETTDDHAKKLSSKARGPVVKLIGLNRRTWEQRRKTVYCMFQGHLVYRKNVAFGSGSIHMMGRSANQRRVGTACRHYNQSMAYTYVHSNESYFCTIYRVMEAWK